MIDNSVFVSSAIYVEYVIILYNSIKGASSDVYIGAHIFRIYEKGMRT